VNFGAFEQGKQMEEEGVTAGNNELGCASAGTESESEGKSLLSQLRHAREVCHKGVVRYTPCSIDNQITGSSAPLHCTFSLIASNMTHSNFLQGFDLHMPYQN